MGYIFLTLSLLAGAAKGYCGKKTSGHLGGIRDSLMVNIIRMVLCVIIGFCLILFGGNVAQLRPTAKLLWIAALSGVSTSVFVVTWLISVRKSAYMMLDIALMLGLLIPLIAGEIFFQEQIKPTQWIGVVILFIAVVIMCSYNNSIKAKLTFSALAVLFISGAASGITDLSQKLFVKNLPDVSVSVFNFYTYVFAGITLSVAFLLMKPQSDAQSTGDTFRKVFGYVVVMAICLFLNSYFRTLAAAHLDAVLLYPLSQSAALILSTLMSHFFFKEKITPKCIIGIVITFIGLLIINVL